MNFHYWELVRHSARLFFITDDFGNLTISIYSPGMAIYLEDWYPD